MRPRDCCRPSGMQGAPAVGRQSAKKAGSASGSRFHTYAWPLSAHGAMAERVITSRRS